MFFPKLSAARQRNFGVVQGSSRPSPIPHPASKTQTLYPIREIGLQEPRTPELTPILLKAGRYGPACPDLVYNAWRFGQPI